MILEADGIELYFEEKRILYDIYIKAKKGEVTGILGRNGTGKTSLLRIIFGDLKPKYKNVRLSGLHIAKPLFTTQKVAYLPQDKLLPNSIPLSKAFKLFGQKWDDFTKEFKSFNIYEKAKITVLSSGERRVIETYLILNSDREVILLDEPFSFVAPIYVDKFIALIQKKKRERILILTDHFYRDVLNVSDTLYLLKNGYAKRLKLRQDLKNEGYITGNH